MSNLSARKLGTFVLFVFCACESALAQDGTLALSYGCIRGDTSYDGNHFGVDVNGNDVGSRYLSANNGLYDPFPRSIKDLISASDLQFGSVKITRCTDSQFYCADIHQKYLSVPPEWDYKLVIPKTLTANRVYNTSDVHIIVSSALVTGLDGAPRIQVTLWQNINGVNTPIELTIEEGRGVVYWDGFKLTQAESGSGQLCVLESEYGLFYQVKFQDAGQ